MTIEITNEQNNAIKAFKEWFSGTHKCYDPFILAGLAGTGKSTIIPYMIEEIGLSFEDCAFCAYTGKASLVLNRKGLPATTIHRLIYEPWTDKDGKVHFKKRWSLDESIKLILVDESSMIGSKLQQDLESFGIPICYVGDHGQLPPVTSDMTNLMVTPSFRLETIHRQAMDNPIIRIAHMAREGKRLPFGTYGDGRVKKLTHANINESFLVSASQVLCGTNKTRRRLNNQLRRHIGFEGRLPVEKDKLICLKNNYDNGLVNGMIGVCRYFHPESNIMGFASDDEYSIDTFIDPLIFTTETTPKWEKNIDQFDYGYAITVHKSQGSQFKNVVLYEEMMGSDMSNHRKWLYTGITRAENRLVIVS